MVCGVSIGSSAYFGEAVAKAATLAVISTDAATLFRSSDMTVAPVKRYVRPVLASSVN